MRLEKYGRVKLDANQTAVLKELEYQLDRPIPYRPELTLLSGRVNSLDEDETWFGFTIKRTKIVGLSIEHQRLKTLPKSIGQLTKLKELYLMKNQLKTLPETFGNLISLQRLDLCENELQLIPESIKNLKNLEVLCLYNNKLASIPQDIGQLKSLRTLSLGANDMRSLPESIGQLKNLRSLNLSGNPLSSLPRTLCQLTNLHSFDLEPNSLISQLVLLWLSRTNQTIGRKISLQMFDHFLLRELELSSIEPLINTTCPFCGSSSLIEGKEKQAQKNRIICATCENKIS